MQNLCMQKYKIADNKTLIAISVFSEMDGYMEPVCVKIVFCCSLH